jgi:hypothetical protein
MASYLGNYPSAGNWLDTVTRMLSQQRATGKIVDPRYAAEIAGQGLDKAYAADIERRKTARDEALRQQALDLQGQSITNTKAYQDASLANTKEYQQGLLANQTAQQAMMQDFYDRQAKGGTIGTLAALPGYAKGLYDLYKSVWPSQGDTITPGMESLEGERDTYYANLLGQDNALKKSLAGEEGSKSPATTTSPSNETAGAIGYTAPAASPTVDALVGARVPTAAPTITHETLNSMPWQGQSDGWFGGMMAKPEADALSGVRIPSPVEQSYSEAGPGTGDVSSGQGFDYGGAGIGAGVNALTATLAGGTPEQAAISAGAGLAKQGLNYFGQELGSAFPIGTGLGLAYNVGDYLFGNEPKTISGTMGAVSGGNVGGYLGNQVGEMLGVGGESERSSVGGAATGALAGAPFGPLGMLIGGGMGLLSQGDNLQGLGNFAEDTYKDAIQPVVEPVWDAANDIWSGVEDVVSAPYEVAEGIWEGISGGGGTIVCTELNRQGLLSRDVMEKDSEYRRQNVPLDAYNGYLRLFTPVVQLMRKSRLFTAIVRPFGVATATEMASRVDPTIKGTLLGKIILKIGIPICRFAGGVNGSLRLA